MEGHVCIPQNRTEVSQARRVGIYAKLALDGIGVHDESNGEDQRMLRNCWRIKGVGWRFKRRICEQSLRCWVWSCKLKHHKEESMLSGSVGRLSFEVGR